MSSTCKIDIRYQDALDEINQTDKISPIPPDMQRNIQRKLKQDTKNGGIEARTYLLEFLHVDVKLTSKFGFCLSKG